MDLMAHVDLYCERTSAAFWAEPANFWTNAAFLLAAYLGHRQARQDNLLGDRAIQISLGLLSAIGIGSAMFHGFATRWAEFCDVIPIGAYVFWFLGVWLRQILAWSWGRIGLGFVGLAALSGLFIAMVPSARVGGSEGYFGVALCLLALGWAQRADSRRPKPAYLLYAGRLFLLSLVFRSIDLKVCDEFPLGTHFLWHLCNAGVLFLTLKALLLEKASRSP
jgi:hypothetical protein